MTRLIHSYEYAGQKYGSEFAVRAAIWEAERKALPAVVTDWGRFGVAHTTAPAPEPPAPTAAELAAMALGNAKAQREEAVEKILVTVDGMQFDGDETSQQRMSRAITAAMAKGVPLAEAFVTWVLADNTVARVSAAQLAEALELAGEAQTALWVKPYTDSPSVEESE